MCEKLHKNTGNIHNFEESYYSDKYWKKQELIRQVKLICVSRASYNIFYLKCSLLVLITLGTFPLQYNLRTYVERISNVCNFLSQFQLCYMLYLRLLQYLRVLLFMCDLSLLKRVESLSLYTASKLCFSLNKCP